MLEARNKNMYMYNLLSDVEDMLLFDVQEIPHLVTIILKLVMHVQNNIWNYNLIATRNECLHQHHAR